MTVRVEASIELATDPDTAFAAVVDLPSQEKWIIATKLYAIEGAVSIPQVGSRMAAFTGVAGVGFLDTMVVTEYDPPWRWVTQHEGQFVQGVGIFEVEPSLGGCRFTWAEELDLPFGIHRQVGLAVGQTLRPTRAAGVTSPNGRPAQKGTLSSMAAPPAVPTPEPV